MLVTREVRPGGESDSVGCEMPDKEPAYLPHLQISISVRQLHRHHPWIDPQDKASHIGPEVHK